MCRVQLVNVTNFDEVLASYTVPAERVEDVKARLKRQFSHSLEMGTFVIHVIEL